MDVPLKIFCASPKAPRLTYETQTTLKVRDINQRSFFLTFFTIELLLDGGTLVIQHSNRIDIECIDARGTIAIDMSEYEESHLETTFLFYSCGSTDELNIVAEGKECSITTSTSERSGKQALTVSLTCPDTSVAQGKQ